MRSFGEGWISAVTRKKESMPRCGLTCSVHRTQVLEGYTFLGNVNELGARLTDAFMKAVSGTTRQVYHSDKSLTTLAGALGTSTAIPVPRVNQQRLWKAPFHSALTSLRSPGP